MSKAKKKKTDESKGSGLFYDNSFYQQVSDLIKRKDYCYLKTHRDAFVLAAIFGLKELSYELPEKIEHNNWGHHIEADAIKDIHDFIFKIIAFRAKKDYHILGDTSKCRKLAEEFANNGWIHLFDLVQRSKGYFDDELFHQISQMESEISE